MHLNRTLRPLALGATAALAFAVAVPAPASALPVDGGFTRALSEVEWNEATCNVADGDASAGTVKQWDSSTGVRTAQTTLAATVANNVAPLDTTFVTGEARSKASGTASGGSFDVVRMSGDAAVTWRAVIGASSDCDVAVSARASASADVTTRKKGRIVIVWSHAGQGELNAEAVRPDGTYVFVSSESTGSGRISLPVPGGVRVHDIGVSLDVGLAYTPFAPANEERTRDGSYEVTMRFKPAS